MIHCRPEDAEVSSLSIELGDIILTATDGLFDNMDDYLILKELNRIRVSNLATTNCWFLVPIMLRHMFTFFFWSGRQVRKFKKYGN